MNRVIIEAKSNNKGQETGHLMGISVSITPVHKVLEKIVQVIQEKAFNKPFFVVTAYSEFFLEIWKNPRFRGALKDADLVVPDGVVVKAAIDYLKMPDKGKLGNFCEGLIIGKRILSGEYKERVIGVKLMETLIRLAVQNKYRVFLLGGWNGVAGRLAEKWTAKGLKVEWDEGWADVQKTLTHTSVSKPVIEKINRFKPDLLFVSFGRFKQELWINQQKENIKAGVIMGVGSAFDELAGEGAWKTPAPDWVERRGLKWLWRVGQDPKHFKRAWNAFIKFGWRIYQEKNGRE